MAEAVSAADIVVSEAAFPYLRAQKGKLEPISGDRAAWLKAYRDSLDDTFSSLAGHLPARCRSVLDVGSGLGGIDILLSRHFDGCGICLLDGECDAPAMVRHARTFNHMGVAQAFLSDNGVTDFSSVAPRDASRNIIRLDPYDLVVSFGSWCFHYAPSDYLGFVVDHCHDDTVLILDVRRDKPEWKRSLQQAFRQVAVAKTEIKFERLVFHAYRR